MIYGNSLVSVLSKPSFVITEPATVEIVTTDIPPKQHKKSSVRKKIDRWRISLYIKLVS